MIKTIKALFRIRQLLRIEQSAKEVSDEIDAFDEAMNGTPPHYDEARPPNGDDYNVMLSITARLKEDL